MEAVTADPMFDPSPFDLPIPKDRYGRKADKLILAFGAFELDRTAEEDLAVFNALERGDVVDLRVRVYVGRADESSEKDFDTGEEQASIRRVLKVQGVETA